MGAGGPRCRGRGLVMAFPLAAAGWGARGGLCRREVGVLGVGGGLCVVCRCSGPGGGWGGDGVELELMVAGGRDWVLGWMGVWASRRVLWALCVRAVRVLRSLAGRLGGCLGIRVGLWFLCTERLLVDGARRQMLRLGGL